MPLDEPVIDLRRVTSPYVPAMASTIRASLEMAAHDPGMAADLRRHRRLGDDADRAAAAAFLRRPGASGELEDRVFLANGTWNVLLMLLATFADGGATVLVERATYRQIRDVAQLLGIWLVGLEMDEEGLRPDALDEACRVHRPKILYCVPTIQNPTAATMSLARRQDVAAVARKHGLIVIEDEAQGLIPEGAPPPFFEILPELTWTVMGLSKCLWVGLRAAYVVAPSNLRLFEQVTARFGDVASWYVSAPSATIATLCVAHGGARAVLDEIRKEARRRNAMAESVLRSDGAARSCNGLHLWLSKPGLSGDALSAAARSAGVLVRSGSEFDVGGARTVPGIRVSLADAESNLLETGLHRLSSLL